MSMWDDAAASARNMISPVWTTLWFSRRCLQSYLAGFCLEMAGDPEAAAFQYRYLARTMTHLTIASTTDASHPQPATRHRARQLPAPDPGGTKKACELVCFVSIGRIPTIERTGRERRPPYAEIYDNDVYLGRTFPLRTPAGCWPIRRNDSPP